MKNFYALLDEQMEDPEFRKEYVRLLEEGRRTAEAERDILAARLAAIEAIVTDWGAGTVHRPRSPHYHRLRAALATGATTNQQEADQ